MSHPNLPRPGAAFVLAALLFAQPSLPAQNEKTPPPPTGDTVVLSPFVVSSANDNGYLATNSTSATRVSLLIQDTPMAINVVTKEFMEDIGGTDLNKALGYSAINSDGNPGSTGLAKSTDANFTIRGLQGFSLFRDGFSAYGMVDMSNIERVEIVKGPASVLYGNAAPGGLINYVTKQPLTQDFADIKLTAGSYDYYQGQIDYNQTFNKSHTLNFRLNADVISAGSFRKWEETSQQFIAPSLKWIISPSTSASVSFEAYKLHKIEPGPVPEYQVPDPSTGGLYTKLVSMYDMVPWDYNWAGPNSYNDRSKWTATGVFDHTFSPNLSTRLSVNAFYDNTESIETGDAPTVLHSPTSIDMNVFYQRSTDSRYAIRNDWNLTGKTGPLSHRLIAGIEHAFDDQFQLGINPRPPLTTRVNPLTFHDQPLSTFSFPPITDVNYWNYNTLGNRTRSQTTADAIYITDVITAFDGRLVTLLGGRYDWLKQDVVYKNQNLKQSRSSPQVSALYKITADIGVYASYSTSIFPNAVSPQGQLFPPLKGIGKEVGFKFDLMEHRVTGTLSFFDIERVNIAQANFVIDPVTGANTNTTSSGGKQQSRGWDSSWVVTVSKEFQFIVDVLKTNPIFTLGRSGATPTAPSPDQGLPTSRGLRGQFSLWGKYTVRDGNWRGFSAGAGVVYIESFRVRGLGLEGLPRDSLEMTPESTRVDATLGYEMKLHNKPVKLSLTCQNVLDERYLIHNSISPLLAPPRTFLLNVTFAH